MDFCFDELGEFNTLCKSIKYQIKNVYVKICSRFLNILRWREVSRKKAVVTLTSRDKKIFAYVELTRVSFVTDPHLCLNWALNSNISKFHFYVNMSSKLALLGNNL